MACSFVTSKFSLSAKFLVSVLQTTKGPLKSSGLLWISIFFHKKQAAETPRGEKNGHMSFYGRVHTNIGLVFKMLTSGLMMFLRLVKNTQNNSKYGA